MTGTDDQQITIDCLAAAVASLDAVHGPLKALHELSTSAEGLAHYMAGQDALRRTTNFLDASLVGLAELPLTEQKREQLDGIRQTLAARRGRKERA